ELPTDRPRPSVQTYRGSTYSIHLPTELALAVRAFSRREGVTLFMTLLATFQTLLYRYTGQDDLIVGSGIANRRWQETESLIGMIINNLMLRARLSGDLTFRELLAQVRDVTLEAYAHQDLPFDKLVEQLHPPRDLSRNPIFQVMFSFHDAAMPDLDFPDLVADLHYAHNRSAKFDLNVIVIPQAEQRIGRSRRDNDDDIMIEWEYNTDLFDESTIVRLVEHYQTLLRAIVAEPTTRLSTLPLMTEQEQRKLLVEWNVATGELPSACVHELIADQALRTPEAIAVVCGRDELSYGALDQRATALAHVLCAQGLGAESLVALCLPRSLDLVVALLAVLKTGAAYLPLDPTHPPARLAAILADAQPQLILSTNAVAANLPTADLPVLDLAQPLPTVESRSLPAVDPDQLAYVIATSGSTGTPKGVQIQHRSLTHLLQNLGQQIGLTADDSLLAVTTISFDIAALEIFLPLMLGMRLVLVDGAMAGDGPHLLERLAASGATVMQATPATWQLLLDAGWQGDSRLTMLCGGEALPRDLANQLLARGNQLWNVYGPTETTIWSTATRVEPGSGNVPIGRPIGRTEAYVLDAQLRLAPIGVWGELYLGGAGLARGYLKRPDLTTAAFVPHPFSAAPGSRLYRTGDRARRRGDGQLEFGGRTDRQVKLRGYRIELGEIQTMLRQHPAVAAAVVMRREDTPGVPRLVAYVVENKAGAPWANEQGNKEQSSTTTPPSPVATDAEAGGGSGKGGRGDEGLTTNQSEGLTSTLREFLAQHLPAYMVPATIVLLDALPLSPSGKLDLRALPAPQSIRPDSAGTFVAPQTSAQRWLARLWSELLGLATIGVDDNFFVLGGHSLLAARIVARIRQQFTIDVPLIRVFEAPTIAQLEAAIVTAKSRVTGELAAARDEIESLAAAALQTDLSADAETLELLRQASDLLEHAAAPRPAPAASARSADGLHIPRLSRDSGPFPLSFAQQRLWFIHQLDPANPIYNLSRVLQLAGQLDAAALEQSLNAVIARHEILRTTFTAVDGVPMQVLADSLSIALPSIDLRSLAEDERDIAVQQHQNDAVAAPFDLEAGPLIRAALLRLTDAESLLLLTMHHIITDEWSINLFIRELAAHYEAAQEHQPSESKPALPDLAAQYIDFAAWQRDWLQAQVVEEQLGYWQQQLANLPTLELPLDRPRPPARTFNSAIQPFTIPASTIAALHELRSREGVTLFMLLLTAFKTLLYRYTGQQDIVVGTPITNRPRVELEDLIGLFINLLVLRTDLAGDPTFRESLRRVRRVAIDAYAHQDLPFERLVSTLAPERDVAIMPLFQVLFVLENTTKQTLTLPSLTLREPEVIAKQVTDYDLTLSVTESNDGLAGVFQYNTDLFDAATIQRLAEHFQQVLHSLSNPDQPISTIPLFTTTERRRILHEWNATAAPLPLEQSLVQLVAAQAHAAPDAPAVIGQHQQLSYADLNRRANRVAHLLQALGVGPERTVAVCLPRSPELLVAILGVLKAGGA
ncbi:MAG: amino acid adenylation domain-containing protein, partial [Chloroflexi bacterium]|nr:amino acid adenylation domain-containing protein [Chloroflexota bacterium]